MPYRRETLGRMAVFLIPSCKLKKPSKYFKTVEERIHAFLIQNFNSYTLNATPATGWWKDQYGQAHYDVLQEYKVSFAGKERIPFLEEFLAEIAQEIGEKSIYFETGEDAWLIFLS